MSYYAIKCQHCLHMCTSEEVLFPTNNNEKSAIQPVNHTLISQHYRSNSTVEPIVDDYISYDEDSEEEWINDDDIESRNANARSGRQKKKEHSQSKKNMIPPYLTYTQFNKYYNTSNENWVDVAIAPKYLNTSEIREGYLLLGFSYRDNEGVVRNVVQRYCPNCLNSSGLNRNSGKMPTYIISMLGQSSSGKTVYLTALYSIIRGSGNVNESGGRLPCFGRISFEYVGASKGFNIEQSAKELRDTGRLPAATRELITEPLPILATVTFGKNRIQSLLFFRDTSGEMYSDDMEDNRIQGISDQFPKFDGFLMMLDPYVFNKSNEVFAELRGEDERKRNERSKEQFSNFRMRLSTDIIPTMRGGIISKPMSVLITKGDCFFRNAQGVKRFKLQSNTAIADKEERRMDGGFFMPQHWGARGIIESLSPAILGFLEDTLCNNIRYMLVSSIGRRVSVEDRNDVDDQKKGKYIAPHNLFQPWRVKESCVQLLMSLGFLPPFESFSPIPITGEDKFQKAEREAGDLNKLNEWGRENCSQWIDVTFPSRGR